uniref:Cytochrome P450 n=1 Tax=Quercus lobata TaxID=97700 RepID=A0A7N2R7Y3_QUELO
MSMSLEQAIKINRRQTWFRNASPVYMYSTGSKPHLYVSDPELLRELRLKSLNNSLDLARSSYWGRPFQPLVSDGIIGTNRGNWAYQRKLIAPEFFLNKVKISSHEVQQRDMKVKERGGHTDTQSHETTAVAASRI